MPTTLRPREKLLQRGIKSLTDSELLALLFSSGTNQKSVEEVARTTKQRFGSLEEIIHTSLDDLQEIPGIGIVRAARVVAAIELGRRLFDLATRPYIAGPTDVIQLTGNLAYRRREYLIAFYLDTRQRLIKQHTVSVGGVNQSQVEPREVFLPGLKIPAVGVILVHNHPSGDATPSSDDITLTHSLTTAGKVLGLPIIDHLIVTKQSYNSLKELGLLEK